METLISRGIIESYFGKLSDCLNLDAAIVGGGPSGIVAAYYLAKQLIGMGIQVKIIEISKARCEELSILLPKAVIINGDGTNEDLLREEGIERAEAVVALTGIDEENILLTLYAKRNPGLKTITKINRITFQDVINSLDLGSVVYPKYITAEAIIRYVRAMKESMDSNIETLYHMFDHRAEAVEFRVDAPSGVTDTPLMELKNYCSNRNLEAKIVAKLEYFNPAGSVKDRIAKAIIEDMFREAEAILKNACSVIE